MGKIDARLLGLMNTVRRNARYIYFLLGILLLAIFCLCSSPRWMDIIEHLSAILWCLSFSSIGIGLGLWVDPKNDPNDIKAREPLHYLTYFIFVLIISTAVSFSIFLANTGLQAYVLSFLSSVTIGFTGDALAGIILKTGRLPQH